MKNLNKRVIVFVIVVALIISVIPASSLFAFAATTLTSHVKIEMAETSSVSAGTIRYVNQSQTYGAQYFYSSYWGSNTSVAGIQCNLASISMGLSYVGANKLPAAMTAFSGVSSAISGSGASISNPSSISAGIDRMQNGNGKYSPVVIHMSAYHTSGSTYEHWVVVADRVSGDTYYIVDPAYGIGASAYYTAQISGNTLTAWGKSSTIDDYYQFYNPNGSISSTPSNASVSTDKSTYALGETVTITPSASGADHFTMRICYGTYGGDTTVFSDFDGFVGSKTYTPTKTGNYIVRVSAVGSSGNFIDSECTFVVEDPSVTVAGLYMPDEIAKGDTPSLSGVVRANFTMNWLYAGIFVGDISQTSDRVSVASTQTNPGSSTYDLGEFFTSIDFANMSEGTYTLTVEGTSACGYFNAYKKVFTITEPKVTVVGLNMPDEIGKGDTPSLSGVVQANFTMSWLYAGIFVGDISQTSERVSVASMQTHPGSTTYDLSEFFASIDFAGMNEGTYTLTVEGTSACGYFNAYKKVFTITEPKATVNGLYVPDEIVKGDTPTLSGVVQANFTLGWIYAGIFVGDISQTSERVTVAEMQTHPDSTTYDLGGFLASIDFAGMSEGTYTLTVEGTSACGYFHAYSKVFRIVGTEVTITGLSMPDEIVKGETLSLSGTVQTSFTMDWLYAGVFLGNIDEQEYDARVKVSEVQAFPNTTSCDLGSFLSGIDFARLSPGTYTLTIEGTGSCGYYFNAYRKVFTVRDKSITITFDANGGNCATENKTVTVGAIYGDLPTATREYYNFDGWYTSSSGGSKVTPATTVTATSNHTLYAHWTHVCANGHDYSYAVTTTPTISAAGVLTGTCSKCSGTTTVTLPKLDTTNYNYSVVTAATCTANGTGRYTWKTTTYGTFTFDVTIPKTGHSYTYAVTTTPTTSTAGVLTGTCSKCSGTTTVTLPKLDTTNYNYSVVTAATCTANGTGRYMWKTTTYGTFTFDVTIPKTGHNYENTVTAPTCTEQGYTTHTCSRCGDNYKDTYVDALGHDFGAWTQTTAPTCTEKGEEKRTCSRCDAYETREIDALGHDYQAAVAAPTCTAGGYTTYTCSRCGDSYVADEVAALGHIPGAAVEENQTNPTCTTNGGFDTVTYCSVCGVELSRAHTDLAALGHIWDDGVINPAATCTSDGVKTFTCQRCGETRTEAIAATGHTPGESAKENEVAATCTTAGGYDMVIRCTVCNAILYTEHFEIAALGHDYQAVVTAPTCTEGGYTTYTCSRCGDSYVGDETTALGHDWGEWCPIPMNFCTNPRIEDRTCNRCGTTESRTLPPDGHVPGEPVKENETAPTCEVAGGYDTVVYCTSCGAEISREHTDVAAIGHDWNEPEYVWATDFSTVTAVRTCKNDTSHKETETVDTTSEVAKPATYEAEGEIVYTASFENEAFATQTKTVAIPKLEKPDDPTPGLPCDGSESCPGNIFTDMPAKGNWAHDAIDWAIVTGITSGTSATTFSPNQGCTRSQVVTFLWRAAGSPEPTTTSNPFKDVAVGAWYYKAVLWASETGVTAGTSATTFSPNQTCTRGQIVTFIWRYEGSPEAATTNNPFMDVPDGTWYTKAVLWASETGVTAGTSATTFSPNATCTRAQIVTFLYRDMEN